MVVELFVVKSWISLLLELFLLLVSIFLLIKIRNRYYSIFFSYILGCGEDITNRKEAVYRGSKGSFHRQQQNPRADRKNTNWLKVFIDRHCGGSVEECEKDFNRFRSLNTTASKKEANGMIAVFIDQGAKETLLREVLLICLVTYHNTYFYTTIYIISLG